MNNLKKLRQNQISLKCEICDKEFKSKNSLKNHFNITHNLEKKYECNICQKDFNVQTALTSHVKIVHGNKKHQKCDSCDKSFSQARGLKKHIDSIHNAQKNHKSASFSTPFYTAIEDQCTHNSLKLLFIQSYYAEIVDL